MTPEQLDAIQARHKVAEALEVKPNGDSHTRDYMRELEAVATDVPALLAYARELAIQLEGVRSDMQDAMADAWDEGVREGWDESGEGWNAEYPLDAKPHSLKHNPYRPSSNESEGGIK